MERLSEDEILMITVVAAVAIFHTRESKKRKKSLFEELTTSGHNSEYQICYRQLNEMI